MPTINISQKTFDRLKKIAIPFEDKEVEDVIKRLLDQVVNSYKDDTETSAHDGKDLTSHSGRIQHGSKLRAKYKGQVFNAEIVDGRVLWDGKKYESVSKAAVAVIQSTGSKRPTENGWRFWEVKEPGKNEWRPGTQYRYK